jgi:Kef-type K+ transport system membrane component KefB
VISRIMFDVGILETPFARIVLTAAVIEYVVLAVALGLVSESQGDAFGVVAMLGGDPTSAISIAYHVGASLAFFAGCLRLGPPLLRRLIRSRFNALHHRCPIAFQLTFLFVLTGVAVFAGITPLFGALVAGMVIGVTGHEQDEARDAIKHFAFAFFVPIYFAIVGLRLDLIHDFNVVLFAAFLIVACVLKAVSTYAEARLAGQSRSGAANLSVAMNARRGPGIVLASVLVAVLTSLAARSWLEHVVKSGTPLLGVDPGRPAFETPAEPALAASRSA